MGYMNYVIIIHGSAKEFHATLHEALAAYGKYRAQFLPHAQHHVVLYRMEEIAMVASAVE